MCSLCRSDKEDRRQETGDRRQKTKDKRQKTKDKRQKTKDKRKNLEGAWFISQFWRIKLVFSSTR